MEDSSVKSNIFKYMSIRSPKKISDSNRRLKFIYYDDVEGTTPPIHDQMLKARKHTVEDQKILYDLSISEINSSSYAPIYLDKHPEYKNKLNSIFKLIGKQKENFDFSLLVDEIEKTFADTISNYIGSSEYRNIRYKLWNSLYACMMIPNERADEREDIIFSIRILNLLHYISKNWSQEITVDVLNSLMNAVPVLPNEIFKIEKEENKEKKLRKPPRTRREDGEQNIKLGSYRTLGIGDLKVVQQTLVKYEAGEVAHIENVMKSESFGRKHRRLNRTEDTFMTETQKTEENTKDLQSTERFELQRESQKTIETDMALSVGVTVTASYGPTVQATLQTDFALNTSESESNRISSTYAKEIVDRSINRVMESIHTQRISKTIDEIEEINTHEFDNSKGDDHVVGIYRWVDKLYNAQILNYGRRLMFEFIIPEPAAFYIFSQRNKITSEIKIEAPEEIGNLTHKDITDDNYHLLIKKFKLQNAMPPPTQYKIVGTSFDLPTEHAAVTTNITKKIKVPAGYRAKYVNAGGSGIPYSDKTCTWELMVGTTFLQNAGSGDSHPLSGEDDEIPITFYSIDYSHIAVTVMVTCERAEEVYEKWQLDIFSEIMNSYQRAKSTYEEQLSAAGIGGGVKISGKNPTINRKIEQDELKKNCISLLTSQNFDDFDSIIESNSKKEYPEVDFAQAALEGRYIQFFEQAFEWEQMTYLFYPYFWGRKNNWIDIINYEDTDPLFTKFLQAGAARVVLPVHPAYESAIIYYLQTGNIWNGGQTPVIDDPLYVSIADELKAETNTLGGSTPEGESWSFKVPTSLVILQPSGTSLPEYK